MSGLASFLKAFLPPKEGEKENYDYHESIANVVSKEDAPQAESPPTDPRTQSASEWRSKRNEGLRIYMEKRMVAPETNDEEDDNDEEKESSEEYVVPDNDEVNVPFWSDEADGSQPTDNGTTSPSFRRKKVPHIDETLHIAKTLSAVDLYAREFHLSLGLVGKVWPLRAIPRREWKISSKFEDDGPLGTLFKHVVSIEVTQLLDNHQVANMAQAAFQARTPQRLLIFFYNKYATQISTLLEREHASRILISLKNIPAKCILPLDEEDFSWYDREGLAPYCLCIGDKSSMKLDQDGALVKIPFDAPDLQATIARVSKDNEAVEVDLTPNSVKGDLQFKETDTLEAAYQEWEEAQKEKETENEQEMQQDQAQDTDAEAGTTRRAESANDGRTAKKARTEEKYHTLSELRDLYEARKGGEGPLVNVFAAVLGFSAPSLAKNYAWKISVTLVDESTPLPAAGEEEVVVATTINIFCKEPEELPKILMAGDVLRMHHVKINEWKGDIQLLGQQRAGKYVVVRPENTASTSPEDNWDIVPAGLEGTPFGQSDRERAAALWKWGQARLADYPTIHKASEKLTISDLARQDQSNDTGDSKTGDLTVMVSAILPVPEALKTTLVPLGYLRVWDGTGPPVSDPLPIASAGAAEAVKKGDPPSEALEAIANAVKCIKSAADETGGDDASSLEPPKCLCGRVMNVAVWEEPNWRLVAETLQVGTFIRLRNVHEGSMITRLKCLMLSDKSCLTPLPNDSYEIKELLKDHQQRVLRKDPYNPQSGVLPLQGEPEQDVDETPMDVEQDGSASIARCISEAAPSSFEVKFHITGTIPSADEGEHALQCLCNANKYQFAVNVNDETAAIDALVPNQVGEALFQLEAVEASDIPSSEAAAIMKDVTSEDKLWKGEIRSFELNGAQFFILDSVAAVHDS